MFLNTANVQTGGTGVRLAALSLGVALVSGAMPGSARADPAPSARDVERSRAQVRERAAEVGRTKARLAQAGGELERAAAASALAVEHYHGERVRLERAHGALQQVWLRVAEADRRIAEARAELTAFAADAYRVGNGGNDWSAVVGGSGGPQGFMDRAAIVEMLAQRRAGALQRVEAARDVADLFRRQVRAAFAEQARATLRAAEAGRAAQAAVARQYASVQRIAAERWELENRLGSAQAKAAELQRERQAALDRAEERRIRQALEAAASASAGTSGSASEGAAKPKSKEGSKTRAGGSKRRLSASSRGGLVVRAALKWLGTPYSWGGGNAKGPSYGIAHGSRIHGFDCSGLALHAWAKAGVKLDHWTGTQWTSGPRIPLNRLRRGDLVFFAHNRSDPGTIHHVGIFIGKGRMVEAPYTGARVRISSIWRNGLIGATRPAA